MKSKGGNILLAIVLAFSLWLYVTNVVSPEQERAYNASVTLEGETALRERGLMIISNPDLTVQVELKGNRQNLNELNSSNLVLVADLSGIYDPGRHELGYTVGFPGNIPYGSVTVMNKEPSYIVVEVAERISRVISVKVEYVGNAAESFIADKTQAVLEYEEVVITGPRETVEQIDHAYIQVDCTNRTEPISESYRFELRDSQSNPVDAALITTNIEQINVSVPVFMTKRIPLKLTVNAGGGATEESAQIEIDPTHIDVMGSESALRDLEEIVLGTLNLADIAGDTERTYTITLPEGVTEMNGISEAKVTVRFPNLMSKEFTVSNIISQNVPEGMEAQLLTKQLTILVRGPKALVSKLTAEQIIVEIDLTGVENTAAVEAKIRFAVGEDELGAVGKYSVNVMVTEATEPTTPTED